MRTDCLFSARETDIPAILAILDACRESLPSLSQDALVPLLRRNILRGCVLLAAAQDAGIAGVCAWSPVLRRISLLAVLPEARGRGIASALLGEALRRMPPGDVTVETFRDGDSRGGQALALYRKFGFQKAGLIDGFAVPMQRLRLCRD